MDARFYNSEEIDIEQLANNLENFYRAQGFQVQQIGGRDQMMVQLKKGSDFEALIGMQAALSVILQRSGGGVIAMIGQQRWIDKAAIGAVGIIAAPVLWPLMLTAGAGAIRQASLGNQVLNVVDGMVRQQRPEIQVGPIPVQIVPQLQQQFIPPPQYAQPAYIQPPAYTPPPAYMPPPPVVNALPNTTARKLRCPSCNTPYEPGDTFCTGCGKALVTLCPNCKTEIKDNTSFCPKCGASIYQSTPVAQSAPVQPPPATVQYTMPQTQPAPTYAPPPEEAQPYVPPTPQEPPVMPATRITISPSAPRQEPPAPPKPQPQPEVYYTPPANLPPVAPRQEVQYAPQTNPQPAPPKPQTPPKKQEEVYYTPPPDIEATLPKTQQAPPVRPQPIAPKPASQAAFNPAATWGNLTFSDGKQIKLSGERALVGRYDHDLGGTQPEVDLSTAQGSDTVSRIHAAFEHIGSSSTLTDLNSTNSTRINGKRLEPDKATPINDGDSLSFGKVTCTFKKA